MIAEVVINSIAKSLNKEFHYIIPINFEKDIKIGMKVIVPFGNMKVPEEAFVTGIIQESKYANKEIISIEEGIDEDSIKLAKLMSRKYFCNISDCIKLMSPPGSLKKNVSLRSKDKTGRFVYLSSSNNEVIETKERIVEDILSGTIKSPKHVRILQFLLENEGIYSSDLETICDVSGAILKTLEKNGYIEFVNEKIERNPFENKLVKRDSRLSLTEEQSLAFNSVKQTIDEESFEEFLIYGITGSGKTEIYLQLIEEVIQRDKSAIVLVPEISLTPQMTNRFLARFGEGVAILHSKLSLGERYDEWNKIKDGKANIVIGARSAIFAPIKNLRNSHNR